MIDLLAKSSIQIGFLFDQLGPKGLRLRFHGIEQRHNLTSLIRRKLQLVGKLQHVRWPGIAVQLCGERETHPASGIEIRYLLLRKGLDGPRLHSGIGSLGNGGSTRQQEKR